MNERIDVAHQTQMLMAARSQVAATMAAAAFARLDGSATLQDLESLHRMYLTRLFPEPGRPAATQLADEIAERLTPCIK